MYEKAYKYLVKSCNDLLESYNQEIDELKDQVEETEHPTYDLLKNILQTTAKVDLLNQFICFSKWVVEAAEKGEI